MTELISLLLPSRGRPDLVRRLFQSIIDETADLHNLEIILYLDEDDTISHGIEERRLNVLKIVGPQATMGAYNTKCLERSSGEIIILMNDDLVMCTPGWDQKIRDFSMSIPDGIFLAYPDDMEKAHLSTFPIMSRKTCEILSNPYPQEYDDLFIDDHLFDIFTRLKYLGENRMVYLNKILFDHRHFINGEVRTDASYYHKNRYKDYITFISLRHLRQVTAQRLYAAIKGRPLPELPENIEMEKPPTNLVQAFFMCFPVFLFDYGLPITRRIRWFIRFTKYYAAMKKGLHFLKRRTYMLYGNK
jgi:hypothetical protein